MRKGDKSTASLEVYWAKLYQQVKATWSRMPGINPIKCLKRKPEMIVRFQIQPARQRMWMRISSPLHLDLLNSLNELLHLLIGYTTLRESNPNGTADLGGRELDKETESSGSTIQYSYRQPGLAGHTPPRIQFAESKEMGPIGTKITVFGSPPYSA